MGAAVIALIRALASLGHPKMLGLMVWPAVVALVLWLVMAWMFWSQATQWVQLQFQQVPTVAWAMTVWPLSLIAGVLGWVVMLLLFVPLVLTTSTLIIGVVSMPMMVNHVASRDYPTLARRNGGALGGMAGGIWNGVVALGGFVALLVLSAPLWLLPFLWPVLPVLTFAWLNQRVFRYDALAEHASAEEMRELFEADWRGLYVLGVLVALIGHIPVVGFFTPVLAGLAFIHYCLASLARLREAPIEGTATVVADHLPDNTAHNAPHNTHDGQEGHS